MVIMPENMVGYELAEKLILGEAKRFELDSKHSIIEFIVPPIWWEKKIDELDFKDKDVVVCAIRREKEEKHKRVKEIIAPNNPELILKEGDSIILLGEKKVIYRLARGTTPTKKGGSEE